MGQAYSPYGFHSNRGSVDITAESMTRDDAKSLRWKVPAQRVDITAESMTRDDSPNRCIQLKGRIVVHTPGMTLYADELTPTSGCGGFVPNGNVRIELTNY